MIPSLPQGAFLDRQGAVRNGWKILGFLVLLNLAGILATPLLRAWPAGWQAVVPGRWFDALVCLAVTWACLGMEQEPLASLGLRPDRPFLRELALGTLGGSLLILLTAGTVLAFGGFHWIRTPGAGWTDLAAGAWFYLAVAVYEELLFRGYAFQRSTRGLGFTSAQVLCGALFALGHWNNPGMAGATKAWATLNIALAALLLGLAWRRTGSLALPIGVHLGWNWAQGPLLGFGVSGTEGRGWWTPILHDLPEWISGGTFGLEASAVCTVLCGAAAFGLWRWRGVSPADGASIASES